MPTFWSPVAKTLSWVVLLSGIGTFAFALGLCLWSYSPLPCADNWYFVNQYRLYTEGKFSLPALLWSIHNGHRIVIPHLFHLADLTLFHGTNVLLLASIFLAQATQVFILGYLGIRRGGFRGTSARVVFGFALFCLFCPVQRENLTCGWEIAYILPFVFASLAFSSLALYARRQKGHGSTNWMVLCIGTALAGTYSLASGIFIWPALLFEAVALRMSRRILSVIGILMLAVFTLRALDVSGEDSRLMALATAHPLNVFRFFLSLFSRSWSATSEIPGSIFTMISLLAVSGLMLVAAISPSRVGNFRIAMLSVSSFAILNAALTALGRWSYGLTGRYQTPIFVFWCALGLIVFSYADFLWKDYGQMAFAMVFILAVALNLKSMPALRSEARSIGQENRIAQAALGSGVDNPVAMKITYMPKAWTFGELNFLAQRNASLYSNSPTSLSGRPLLQYFRLNSTECAAELRGNTWVTDEDWPGIVLSGWVRSKPADGPLKWIIVTDERQRIVGFGSSAGLERFDDNQRDIDPEHLAWKAFVPASAVKDHLFLYRVLHNREVCAVNPSRPLVPVGGPSAFDDRETTDLVPLWSRNAADAVVSGGTGAFEGTVLTVKSSSIDTQIVLNPKVDLKQFQTLVLKAKFERRDTLELYFAQQGNGRGLIGYMPLPGEWIYVFAQVGQNPFWKEEAGSTFRFDPTGLLGVKGSLTQISGMWGSRNGIGQGPDPFEFAVARKQQP